MSQQTNKYYRIGGIRKNNRSHIFTPEERALIAKDYANYEKTINMIEIKWKTSSQTIRKIAQEFGLPIRPMRKMPSIMLDGSPLRRAS